MHKNNRKSTTDIKNIQAISQDFLTGINIENNYIYVKKLNFSDNKLADQNYY